MVRGKAQGQNTPAPQAKPKTIGRPSTYTDEIAEEICEAIATGGALYKLCEANEHWPAERTVFQWLEARPTFAQNYARARERQADRFAHEGLEKATNAKDAALGRLAWDAYRWHASKFAPKKYGDKVVQEHTGKDGGPIETKDVTDEHRARALAAFLMRTSAAKDGE